MNINNKMIKLLIEDYYYNSKEKRLKKHFFIEKLKFDNDINIKESFNFLNGYAGFNFSYLSYHGYKKELQRLIKHKNKKGLKWKIIN